MNLRSPTVYMGLPSPGTDFENFSLDLNSYLIKNPTSTFFMKLDSNVYAKLGFYRDDILVIDRSCVNKSKPQIYEMDSEFKVFLPFKTPAQEAVFWGTVVGVVRKI